MRTCGEDRPTERVGDTPRCENQGPESDQFMLVVMRPKSSCGRVRLMPGSPLPVLSGWVYLVCGRPSPPFLHTQVSVCGRGTR